MEKREFAPEAAIWEKKDKKGNTYLSLKQKDGTWITFFRNKNKKNDKMPDWREAPPPNKPSNGDSYQFNSKVDDFGAPPSFNSDDSEVPF